MKDYIYKTLAYVLTIFLMTGAAAEAFPKKSMEPANPISEQVSELKTDIKTKSGGNGKKTEAIGFDGKGSTEQGQEKNREEGEKAPPRQKSGSGEEKSQKEAEEQQNQKEDTIKNENQEEIQEENQDDEKSDSENKEDGEERKSKEDIQEEGEIGESESLNNSGNGGKEQGTGGNPGNGNEGNEDERNPNTNQEGNMPTEGGEEIVDGSGTGEVPGEDEHGLVTDLYDQIILFSELENNILDFFAYYSDAEVEADIRVNYRHSSDSTNGIWLEKIGEHDYSTSLSLGQNYITIYYTDGDGVRNWARITITYQADRADAQNPVRGYNPPIIKTNLDDWTDDIRIFEFTFIVDVKKYDGTRIYSNNIQVWMDGVSITNPTGSGVYEYLLEFGMPIEGNTTEHVVSVLAWDDEGNSRYVSYNIRHKVNDEGIVIGTVTVEIDVTTLGLGIIDEAEVVIASGDTAATAVIKMLEENGYDYTHTGDIQTEFYLSSISRADAFRGAAIEERLRRLIERDGITFLPDSGRDRLGEFDYTRGAGWMYFLNGEICPGKSMSDYMLNGGEHISLRFTLAFGKDVGASFADSNTSLSSYCGKWVNGTILEYEHDYREAERLEATREQPGYILYLCDQCKEEKKEILEYVPPEGGETPEERPPEGGEAPEEVPPEVPPEGGEGSEEVPPEVPPEGGDDIPTEGESDVSGNGN